MAAQYVQHANPDGYTLMMATNSPLSADPFLLREVSYDPVKDFAPVTRVGSFTLMLVVTPSLPVHSVKELVAYAKANPGKLSFASGNTAGIVGGKTLAHWAGLDMLHVPYKSSPPAIEDVIAGRVSMMIVDFTVAMPHVSSGQVRALAVTRLKRSPLFPDLPTLDEAGIEGFEIDAWAGLVAPAKTPPAVVAKLNAAHRQDHRRSGDQTEIPQCRLRRLFLDAGSSSATSSRSSSPNGARWSATPASSRTKALAQRDTASQFLPRDCGKDGARLLILMSNSDALRGAGARECQLVIARSDSDKAIQTLRAALDCFASLAMTKKTEEQIKAKEAERRQTQIVLSAPAGAGRATERPACAAPPLRARSPVGVPPRFFPWRLVVARCGLRPCFLGRRISADPVTIPIPGAAAAQFVRA